MFPILRLRIQVLRINWNYYNKVTKDVQKGKTVLGLAAVKSVEIYCTVLSWLGIWYWCTKKIKQWLISDVC